MKHVKHLLSLLLVAALLAAATACGGGAGADQSAATPAKQDDGPKGFVESYLQLLTTGDAAAFAKLSGEDEATAQADFDEVMGFASETLDTYGVSEETLQSFLDATKKVLASAKYTVGEPVETDAGYDVPVEIEPITGLFDTLYTEVEDELQEVYQSGEVTDENLYDWMFTTMAEKLEEQASSPTYGEAQSVTVQVVKDGDTFAFQDQAAASESIGALLIDTAGFTA